VAIDCRWAEGSLVSRLSVSSLFDDLNGPIERKIRAENSMRPSPRARAMSRLTQELQRELSPIPLSPAVITHLPQEMGRTSIVLIRRLGLHRPGSVATAGRDSILETICEANVRCSERFNFSRPNMVASHEARSPVSTPAGPLQGSRGVTFGGFSRQAASPRRLRW
jgi:hypothetical protein